MVRQRWSEADRYRKLTVGFLFGQAGFTVVGVVVLTSELSSILDGKVGVAVLLTVVASLVLIALYAMTAWAVLSGSFGARVLATFLSAMSYLAWFPQYVLWFPPTGWLSMAISVLAVATCAVVWLRDPTERVVAGMSHPRPVKYAARRRVGAFSESTSYRQGVSTSAPTRRGQ